MHRKIMLAAAAIAVVGSIALSGCADSSAAGEEDPGVWGYVARADDAQLDVNSEQIGTDELVVDRVLVPENAWVVVHADDNGAPGERVGLIHIDEGESTSVSVPLEGVMTSDVIVAIHADRGTEGEFDFDMMNKEMSPDRPFFVDGEELAAVVRVR
jgi:hypothetical protein